MYTRTDTQWPGSRWAWELALKHAELGPTTTLLPLRIGVSASTSVLTCPRERKPPAPLMGHHQFRGEALGQEKLMPNSHHSLPPGAATTVLRAPRTSLKVWATTQPRCPYIFKLEEYTLNTPPNSKTRNQKREKSHYDSIAEPGGRKGNLGNSDAH